MQETGAAQDGTHLIWVGKKSIHTITIWLWISAGEKNTSACSWHGTHNWWILQEHTYQTYINIINKTQAPCVWHSSGHNITRLHHVSGVIIPKQYINNSLSHHHRWINWMNQRYRNSPNLKTPSSYSDLVSELRFGNNAWCRDWNGSDPCHVQGCQDGSTGLESQVPGQKCHPPVDARPWVDMDPDGSGWGET